LRSRRLGGGSSPVRGASLQLQPGPSPFPPPGSTLAQTAEEEGGGGITDGVSIMREDAHYGAATPLPPRRASPASPATTLPLPAPTPPYSAWPQTRLNQVMTGAYFSIHTHSRGSRRLFILRPALPRQPLPFLRLPANWSRKT
jgi:hypothetical protein